MKCRGLFPTDSVGGRARPIASLPIAGGRAVRVCLMAALFLLWQSAYGEICRTVVAGSEEPVTYPCTSKLAVTDAPLYLMRGVPPNLILSLDNSTSMRQADSVEVNAGDVGDVWGVAHVTNPLYYNPETLYKPPLGADGVTYFPTPRLNAVPANFYGDQFCTDCSAAKLTGALSRDTCASLCDNQIGRAHV